MDHRQCRQRDHGNAGVDAEHGDQHEVDGLGDVVAGVLGLLGHVRDGLDPRVGDHRDRQREDQLRPARSQPEMHLVDQQRGVEHEHEAEADEQHLRAEVGDRQEQVELGRLAQAADVQGGEQHDRHEAADDVARVVRQRREERAQVVGHEERRDGDRDDVVEAQRPAGEERDDVVERVACEGRGAAGFGKHRGALGIRLGRQHEQAAGEHEDERRETERVRGDQAQRVIDRGADVAVGRREQPRHSDGAAQAVL